MTVPFTQYLESKDNYCLGYFGEDKDLLNKILEARNYIEKELPGLRGYIVCKDYLKPDGENIIIESWMPAFKGKMAHFFKLEEKDDLKDLLINSKIPIPDNF